MPSFARVAAPLTDLLRKGKPAQLEDFGEKESEAFENLKQLLTSAPVLSLPRDDLPVSIETDASDYQIGVVLMQTHEDGEKHPVGYWSRTLQPAERNYSTTEKECLALVWSCQILRPYLEGRHFTAYTDHQCLRWLLDATDVSGRLARWRLRLSEFTFRVEYRKGSQNAVADAMSRLLTSERDLSMIQEEIPAFLVEAVEEEALVERQ